MPGIERGPRGTSATFQGKINLTEALNRSIV